MSRTENEIFRFYSILFQILRSNIGYIHVLYSFFAKIRKKFGIPLVNPPNPLKRGNLIPLPPFGKGELSKVPLREGGKGGVSTKKAALSCGFLLHR